MTQHLEELIEHLERATFEEWYSDWYEDIEGKEKAWSAWKARASHTNKCRGVESKEGRGYLAPSGQVCDKCGRVH